MTEFINVKVKKDDVIDLLVNRVTYWSNNEDVVDLYRQMYERYIDENEDVVDLYRQMYERYIDEEVFDILDIDLIVDNDFINDCIIIEKGDEDFKTIQDLAKKGYYDIFCETCYSFIEAYNEDFSLILVRY